MHTLLRCLVLAGVVSCAVAGPAAAQSPGSGYTFEEFWNCGLIANSSSEVCWEPGTFCGPCAHEHTVGWMRGYYTGSGAIRLCAGIQGSTSRGSCGYNDTRVCYYAGTDPCQDQDFTGLKAYVTNAETNGSRHTVKGQLKS